MHATEVQTVCELCGQLDEFCLRRQAIDAQQERVVSSKRTRQVDL